MSVRLFVGNLPYSVTENDVRDHFATVGPVASVKIPVDRETGRSRGFAFVEYADRALAEEAIRRLHNQPLGGRNLAVNEAKPPERTGGPPPRRDGPPGSGFSPRPGGPPPGRFDGPGGPPRMGPPGGPRPGGPPGSGPPRPGGFRGDSPPSFDGDPFGSSRGFDSPPRRPKKAVGGGGRGGKKWTERERAPKGPLQERGGGRFYSVDDAEEDLENLGEEFEDIFKDDDEEADELAESDEPGEPDEPGKPTEPGEREASEEE
jgi:RNA recognition motif-containing protein